MKTNKEGIMQIPNKNKVDFGEMIIRENLFRKGIDPKTITNEQQLDNILNTPTVSPKPMPKKSGEVIDVDFGKPIDPEDMADGGVAGLLGERPGYNKGLSVLGFTPEHAAAVDEMDKNFTGSQFDYAAASTKDMVDRASNPLTAVASAVGNVVGRPAYDFVDAAQKYSDKGYQGEFSFTPQGAKDFYGNLKSLGSEFLNQKPGTMMGGALKGGIQSLGTTLGESIYDVVNPTPANADEIDMKAMMAKEAQFKKKQQQTKTFKQIEAAAAQKAAKEAAAKEAAQRAATKQQAAQNKASGRGGYQSSWGGGGGGGFMGGSGTAAEMGSFADGGPARQNFAMGRRAFLKLMGGVGAGIGALKTGALKLLGKEPAKQVAKEVAKDVATGSGTPPPYFFNLVKKIKNLGDDVTKKFATKDREIVHTTKIDDDATVTVYRDLNTDNVRVDIDDATKNVMDDQGNATVSLEVRSGKSLADETTGPTTPGNEFEAVETDYRNYMDGPDDFVTENVENVVNDTKNLTADLTKVKLFAKGQKKPTIKEIMIQRDRAKTLKQAEDTPAEYAADRGPEFDPDYDDYASGGIARMLGE